MLLLILGENNFMLNYKWHHFHSYVASVMCQESSILNSEPAKLHLWYLL